MYDEVLINAIAKFGMSDILEINGMDFYELDIRNKAYEVKKLEKIEMLYLNAEITRMAKATNKKGDKYEVKDLLKHFKKEKQYKKILNSSDKREINNRLYQTALRVKEYREKGGING